MGWCTETSGARSEQAGAGLVGAIGAHARSAPLPSDGLMAVVAMARRTADDSPRVPGAMRRASSMVLDRGAIPGGRLLKASTIDPLLADHAPGLLEGGWHLAVHH